MTKPSISIIGAGNVGWHMGNKLCSAGYPVEQVFSRALDKAQRLAEVCKAEPVTDVKAIHNDADVYIFAVTDTVLTKLPQQLQLKGKLLVHVSGTMDLSVLPCRENKTGVLYPLQSIKADEPLDWDKVPVLIEASGTDALEILREMGNSLASHVIEMDSEKRKQLHLGAVWVNNFVNHIFYITKTILETKNLRMDLLRPLAEETVRRAFEEDPKKTQTGPARRGDQNIISLHQHMLEKQPMYNELYTLLSESIHRMYVSK